MRCRQFKKPDVLVEITEKEDKKNEKYFINMR
jgi:hypothetical protein